MGIGIGKKMWFVLVVFVIGAAGAFAQQTPAGSKEVPLGSPGATSLDLQISGKAMGSGSAGMDGMEGQMMADMMKMAQGMMSSGMEMSEMSGKGEAAGMGGMTGMGGAAPTSTDMNGQLLQQLLVTNSLVTQLLTSLASSNAPANVLQTQLNLINQLLSNQAAMMQTMAGVKGTATQSTTMSGMPGM